jgi:hypothetical protein
MKLTARLTLIGESAGGPLERRIARNDVFGEAEVGIA